MIKLKSQSLSDILLALLLPFLIVCVIAFKNRAHSASSSKNKENKENEQPQPQFSTPRVHAAFFSYAFLSQRGLEEKRTSYAKLSATDKQLAQKIGYEEKLDTSQEIINRNGIVAKGVVELMEEEVPALALAADRIRKEDSKDLSSVRQTFKHFVRDWSAEGSSERTIIFEPILDVLDAVPLDKRRDTKVLLPGCGLGRLAWEISNRGFDTTANDISPYMISCLRFLLSPKYTPKTDHHIIAPFAHWFSHQRTNAHLFRLISFPDVLPRASPTFNVFQGDFMSLSPPTNTYDYIVTLFFIDTSLNVISTLRQIHTLLRPGGTWINLGPLLWTSGSQAKLELSLDEVLLVAEDIGFRFEEGQNLRRRTIECEYTADKESMMTWIYRAEFWVARKL